MTSFWITVLWLQRLYETFNIPVVKKYNQFIVFFRNMNSMDSRTKQKMKSSQPAITCSELSIETLKQGVKYSQCGSCAVFLVHGTILQQWSSLLKNSASIEKRKICPWLLNNPASDCWRIVPATVDQSCQWLLNNRASDCWTIVPATVEQFCQWLLNIRASDCWTFVPVTVEQSCQWLLNNHASYCWIILPVTVK